MTLLPEMGAYWCCGVFMAVLGDSSPVAHPSFLCSFASSTYILSSGRTFVAVSFIDDIDRFAVDNTFDWDYFSSIGYYDFLNDAVRVNIGAKSAPKLSTFVEPVQLSPLRPPFFRWQSGPKELILEILGSRVTEKRWICEYFL